MPKIDPKQFRLLTRSPAGKISVKEITAGAMPVDSGFAYTVVDAGSGKLPAKLAAKRSGQDLQIYVDGEPLIRLEAFYAPVNGNTAFDGSGELFAPLAGNYSSGYALVTGDPLGASDKVIVGKPDPAPEGDGWAWTTWAGVIGLGVLAGAAAGAGGSSGGGTGGNNGGGSGGNNGGGTGGNNGGGNTGGSTPLPPLKLITTRAGIAGPDGLAQATVQIRWDANADGRIDASEAASPLSVNLLTASPSSGYRGQFALPAVLAGGTFNPSDGVLRFTSTGGTRSVLGSEVAVTGSVQSMAYLTHPVIDSDSAFQVVLSPLTTLGSNLFRHQLTLGVPAGTDLARAYAESLGFVADALGASMSVQGLMSVAPERSPAHRLVAELQANALLNVLVSLASGKSSAPSDAAALAVAEATSADIAYRLANYITQHGSLDLTDPAQLKLAIASVLPASLAVDEVLADSLATMMDAYAWALKGETALSRIADSVLPEFARIVASLNLSMNAGGLSSDALQSGLKTAMDDLLADLRSKMIDAHTSTGGLVHVIVDSAGNRLDLNFDGRIDDQDKVGNDFVIADFGAGKNADPAANRVFVTYQTLPTAAQSQFLKTFGADDASSFLFDTGHATSRLDLKWSAVDANAALKKQDLMLAARGARSTALLSIGKFPAVSSIDGVTSSFGALTILAAGDAVGFNDASGLIFSKAALSIGLGGKDANGAPIAGSITGPVRVQAAGFGSSASMTALSNAGIDALDLSSIATGGQADAMLLMQAAANGILKASQVTAISHASYSASHIHLGSVDGDIRIASQISALAAGDGSTSLIQVTSSRGGIVLSSTSGSTTTYGDISAIATGSTLLTLATDQRTTASVSLSSGSGSIRLGSIRVLASGANSSATIVAEAATADITVNGSLAVSATGAGAIADLELSGYSSTVTGTGLMIGSSLTIDTSADASASLVTTNLQALRGQASLQGFVSQSAVGTHSVIRTTLSAADSLTVGQQITVASAGALSSAELSLNASSVLSIGASGSTTETSSVTLSSAGYNSTALLSMTGDVIVAGDVILERSGATAVSLPNETRLSISGITSMVDLRGTLELTNDISAANGRVTALIGDGNVSSYTAKIGGDLLLQSAGYDSRVEFKTGATGGLSDLDISGQWRVVSAGAGDAVALGYGSLATVHLSGAAPSLHLSEDLLVVAASEFSRAFVTVAVLPASAPVSASGSIDGDLLILATGYASQAGASFSGSSTPGVTVLGKVMVEAYGAASGAILSAADMLEAKGSLSVLADSGINAVSGAFASLSISMDADGSRTGTVNAVRSNDVAVLDVNNPVYGGSYHLGSASGAGTVYLQINHAAAENIHIDFQQQGAANILLGSQDTDLSVDQALAGIVTIDGFRAGKDALIVPWAPAGGGFQMSGYPFFSDLPTFLRDAMRDIGSEPFPRSDAAAYRSAYSYDEDVTYIAYDLDGVGLTGVVRLSGNHYLFSFSDPVTLPVATGITTSVINPSLRTTAHSASVALASGDISKATLVLSAAEAEKQTLTLKTDDGSVTLQSLSATAQAYLSQAIVELTPGSGSTVPVPELSVTGDIQLAADGRLAYVELSSMQTSGRMTFSGVLNAVASSDTSLIKTKLSGGGNLNFAQRIQLHAAGAYSAVDFISEQPTIDIVRTYQKGVSLLATGFQSRVKFSQNDGNDSHTNFNDLVTVHASGAESSATMTFDYLPGDLVMAGDLQLIASGDQAEAGVTITKDYLIALDLSPVIRVGADVSIQALGQTSTANLSIVSTSNPQLEIGGDLTVEAVGDSASANFSATLTDGLFSAGRLVARATGTGASAGIDVTQGGFVFQGSAVAKRIGGGNVSADGDVIASVGAMNAKSSVALRTFNGDITVTGNVSASAQFGNAGASDPDAKISLGAGAGRLTAGDSGDILDYGTISGYGAVTISGSVSAISNGVAASSDVALFSVSKALTIGAGIQLIATGTSGIASGSLRAFDGPDANTPTTIQTADIRVTGAVQLDASGTASGAQLSAVANLGAVSLSGTSTLIASGVNANADLSVSSLYASITASGDLQASATATGSRSHIQFTAGELHQTTQPGTPSVTIDGGLHLLASGTDSESSIELEALSGKISIAQNITVGALGEGSSADLSIHQGAGTQVTVAGTILMMADSSAGNAAGALAEADLTLGKLGAAPIDLFLNAIQQDDSVSATLRLHTDGGRAKLGGDGESGLTTLTLGETGSTANQLLDQIDISFTDTSGKAVLNFAADQDSVTGSSIQQVLVTGFRIGDDELNFGGLSLVSTSAKTLESFISNALSNFNTTTSSGTTTATPVAEVFIGGNDTATYLAYDHDGTGISAIIVLDGVSASAYKTANGLA